MKLAIFGGNGFIGKALQKYAQHGNEIQVFDIPNENVNFPDTFVQKLKEFRPDVVVNLVGILGGIKDSPSIYDLLHINVMGNLEVLRASNEAGVKQYIFISSLSAHGENKIGLHQNRYSTFNPKHGYAASKASAEFSMMQFLKEAPEMKIIAVRPSNVLGEGTLLPHAPIEFIKTILEGRPIEIYGEGLHEREWIWVDDVAEGILKAIEYGNSAKPGYHPFFLSAARISMRDLAEKIASKLGGKVIYTPSTSQAFTLTSEFQESQSLLGWSPRYTIDDMIEMLISSLKKDNTRL